MDDVCLYREEREKELKTRQTAPTDQSAADAAQTLERAKQ